MKVLISAFLLLLVSAITSAQTVFTYGNKQVDKQEFLNAFNKNPIQTTDRQSALNDYLGLYINFKLNVQAGYDAKLNETASFKNELKNFKRQLAESLINEESDSKKLLAEAYERSKKDIHVAQIFIPYNNDTAKALALAKNAIADLKKGKSFESVFNNFTTDAEAKKTNGEIGYITVFTLPYAVENEIYGLKVNQSSSTPFKGKNGFHIFKNLGERKAVGRRKVAQILIALPPNASEELVKTKKALADTIYQTINRGEQTFESMAAKYSNDLHSNNGLMPEVGIGQYNTAFEEKLYSLKKEGDILPPFQSAYGFHILKLVEVITPAKSVDEDEYVKHNVESGDRLAQAKNQRMKKWQQLSNFQRASYNEADVYAYVDSSLKGRSKSILTKNIDSVVLFTISKDTFYAKDFKDYATMLTHSGNTLSSKSMSAQMKEFEKAKCMEYYRDHYDEFNSSMQKQIKEFEEANLLFISMEKYVWEKATADSLALQNYYKAHEDKYIWNKGVAGILVTTSSKDVAKDIAAKITENVSNWRNIVSKVSGLVSADSNRYEYGNLPIKQKIENKEGFVSDIEKGESDDLYSFFLVSKVYDTVSKRTFEEARGLVINDYQNKLEADWVKTLKEKYPVNINTKNWNTIH